MHLGHVFHQSSLKWVGQAPVLQVGTCSLARQHVAPGVLILCLKGFIEQCKHTRVCHCMGSWNTETPGNT